MLAGGPRCVVAGCDQVATEVDHIVALENGGEPYALWNLQAMCKPHNAAKGARTDWAPDGGLPAVTCRWHDPAEVGCPHAWSREW